MEDDKIIRACVLCNEDKEVRVRRAKVCNDCIDEMMENKK